MQTETQYLYAQNRLKYKINTAAYEVPHNECHLHELKLLLTIPGIINLMPIPPSCLVLNSLGLAKAIPGIAGGSSVQRSRRTRNMLLFIRRHRFNTNSGPVENYSYQKVPFGYFLLG